MTFFDRLLWLVFPLGAAYAARISWEQSKKSEAECRFLGGRYLGYGSKAYFRFLAVLNALFSLVTLGGILFAR